MHRSRFPILLAAASAFLMQAGMAATGQVAPAASCSFQPPSPILAPHAYPGQVLARQSGNRLLEQARLDDGLRIEIRQQACVDFLTTEFTLVVPRDGRRSLDRKASIALVRDVLARLKTLGPADEYSDLADFLGRAPNLRPRDGRVGACKDGSAARPGECTWDSQGGYLVSVQRGGRDMRISVRRYAGA